METSLNCKRFWREARSVTECSTPFCNAPRYGLKGPLESRPVPPNGVSQAISLLVNASKAYTLVKVSNLLPVSNLTLPMEK